MEMIYIAGMMGAGKSTVGRALAQRLELRFIDLDNTIEERVSMSISEIFEKKGEDYFRELESRMLKETAEHNPAVVALGGGTLTRLENLHIIKNPGRSIYLRASVNYLAKNLQDYSDRPLLASESTEESLRTKLEELLLQRKDSYEACDFVFDVDSEMSAEDITECIVGILGYENT